MRTLKTYVSRRSMFPFFFFLSKIVHFLIEIDSAGVRKGINEQETVDEFTAYWIGLEVIKSILRRMLKMRAKDPGEWDGIRDIYENELHFNEFDKVEEARNKLLHGYEVLSTDFINEIGGYVEPTRRTLVASIACVLGLQNTTEGSLQAKKVRRLRKKPWHVVQGELENLPQNLDEMANNFPRIDAKVQPTYGISDDGKLNMQINITHHFSGPKDLQWHLTGTELWGDNDSGIDRVESKEN